MSKGYFRSIIMSRRSGKPAVSHLFLNSLKALSTASGVAPTVPQISGNSACEALTRTFTCQKEDDRKELSTPDSPSGLSSRRRTQRKEAGEGIHEPRVLVITPETKDKMDEGPTIIRKRFGATAATTNAFNILEHQIHDLGDLEDWLDDDAQITLRKHIILWKAALAMPRRKLGFKDKGIPIAATSDMTRSRKFFRLFNKPDSGRANGSYSIAQDMCNIVKALGKTEVSAAARMRKRRIELFDSNAPAYSSYMVPPATSLPNLSSIHSSKSDVASESNPNLEKAWKLKSIKRRMSRSLTKIQFGGAAKP